MSENTILYALYRMGYHSRATGHGFRRTAASSLREMGFAEKHIEMQLAHVEPNKTRLAYNSAEYLIFREPMMQHWSDFIDAVSEEGNKATVKDFMVRQWA